VKLPYTGDQYWHDALHSQLHHQISTIISCLIRLFDRTGMNPLPLVINGDQCDRSKNLPSKDIALLYNQLQTILTRQHSRPNIFLEPRRSHPHSTPIHLRQMTFSLKLSFGDFPTHADTGKIFPSKAKTVLRRSSPQSFLSLPCDSPKHPRSLPSLRVQVTGKFFLRHVPPYTSIRRSPCFQTRTIAVIVPHLKHPCHVVCGISIFCLS
jgi:hypothetical protein